MSARYVPEIRGWIVTVEWPEGCATTYVTFLDPFRTRAASRKTT